MFLIAASLWWAVHPIGVGRKAILLEAREIGHEPGDAANVYGAGSDDS